MKSLATTITEISRGPKFYYCTADTFFYSPWSGWVTGSIATGSVGSQVHLYDSAYHYNEK